MKQINSKIKTLWGISEVGFSIMSTTETAFFVFFLTDIAQLPLAITGIITSFSAIADAISSVIAGMVIDKVTFKNGKYRPWLIYCTPVVTVFFILQFSKIGGDTLAGLLCGIGYVMSHFIWNICWTANRNLIPVLTEVPEEKAFLSARIAAGSSLGKVIASYGVPVMSTALLAVMSGVTAYTVIALLAGICFIITYLIHFLITKGYDEPDPNEVKGKAVTLGAMAKGIATNPPLIIFLLHDALRLTAYYGIAGTAAYYAKVVLEDTSVMSWLLVMFYIGNVLGSLLSNKIVKKWGSKKTNYIGMAGWIIFHLLCYILPAKVAIIAVCLFISQFSYGIAYGLTSNFYSMCGAYSEWKTGQNTRGVIMAFCALAIKIGVAIRGALIAAILTSIAYNPNTTVMTAAAKSGIKNLFILIPGIILIVSMIPFIFFKLDDGKVVEMEKEIAERKANKA